eukprot:478549-Rhodomonas_salina.1
MRTAVTHPSSASKSALIGTANTTSSCSNPRVSKEWTAERRSEDGASTSTELPRHRTSRSISMKPDGMQPTPPPPTPWVRIDPTSTSDRPCVMCSLFAVRHGSTDGEGVR